jgi:hypothetical protein
MDGHVQRQRPAASTGGVAGHTTAAELDVLLAAALDDGAVYSALVPWATSQHGAAVRLGEWARQRPQLQRIVAAGGPAADALPVQFRARALAAAHRACLDDAAWGTCTRAGGGGDGLAPCELAPRGARLAKLQGHLLAHGLVPAALEELALLIDKLAQAPLPAAPAPTHRRARVHGSKGGAAATNAVAAAAKERQPGERQEPLDVALPGRDEARGSPPAGEGGGTAGGRLLPCCCAVARYAAKALECCGRLLAGLEPSLIQQLAGSATLAALAPQLAHSLVRAAVAPPAPSAGVPDAGARLPGAGTPSRAPAPAVLQGQQRPGDGGGGSEGAGCGSRQHLHLPVYSPAKQAVAAAAPGSVGTGARRRLAISSAASPVRLGAPVLAPAASAAPYSAGAGTAGSGELLIRAALPAVGLLKPSGGRPRDAGGGAGAGAAPAADAALVANRERGRDAFFSALRDVTSRLMPLRQHGDAGGSGAGAGQLPQQRQGGGLLDGAAAAPPVPEAGGFGQRSAVVDLEDALLTASGTMQRLLAALAPESLRHLAELFTACVLQAASTGEALVEPRLVVLAEKDPGRFQKLQQRFNKSMGGGGGLQPGKRASGGAGGCEQLVGALVGARGAVALGVVGSSGARACGAGAASGAPRGGACSGGRLGGSDAVAAAATPRHQGARGSGAGLAAAYARTAAAARLLQDFPPAQQPFVCLLEAADSARLNASLLRVMAARAVQLMAPLAGRPLAADALGQQCRAALALGRFIGHLAFAAADVGRGSCGGGAEASDAGAALLPPLPPLALLPLLEAAAGSAWGVALAVPFACQCLASLPRGAPGIAASESVQAALLWLRRLQAAPSLRPHGPGFGQLAVCLSATVEALFRSLAAAGIEVPELAAAQPAGTAACVTPADTPLASAWASGGGSSVQEPWDAEAVVPAHRQPRQQQLQHNSQQHTQQQPGAQEAPSSPASVQGGAGGTPIPFFLGQRQQQQQQQAGECSSASSRMECTSQQLSHTMAKRSQQQHQQQQQQQGWPRLPTGCGPIRAIPRAVHGETTPGCALARDTPPSAGSVCSSNTACGGGAAGPRPRSRPPAASAATPPSERPQSMAGSRRRDEAAESGTPDGLADVLSAGSGLVDGLYWSLTCPGRSRLAQRLEEMQQRQRRQAASAATWPTAEGRSQDSRGGAGPMERTASKQGGTQQKQNQQESIAGGAGASAPCRPVASAGSAPASSAASGGAAGVTAASGPCAAAAAARRRLMVVPALVAPRGPPPLAEVPASLLAALQAPADPIRQQLRVALLAQYSPDEQPVGAHWSGVAVA